MKRYWIYNLLIALAAGLGFFINEFSFYGTLLNICINIALSTLLCLQFLFSVSYWIYEILNGRVYSRGNILLAAVVLCIICILGLFVFTGGVWDTDTATFRECYVL